MKTPGEISLEVGTIAAAARRSSQSRRSSQTWLGDEHTPARGAVNATCEIHRHSLSTRRAMLVHWKRGKGEPDAAPELLREVTVAVACGNTHSASVTAAGDALTWGSGGFGELGDGELTEERAAPAPVPASAAARASSPSRAASTTPRRCATTARCGRGAGAATASSASARARAERGAGARRGARGAPRDRGGVRPRTTPPPSSRRTAACSAGASRAPRRRRTSRPRRRRARRRRRQRARRRRARRRRCRCGGRHAVARATDGSLHAWGANDHGQLGVGDAKDRRAPAAVALAAAALDAGCGEEHSAALTADAGWAVWCWGRCDFGARGASALRPSPLAPPPNFGAPAVAAIACGAHHSACVLRSGEAAHVGGARRPRSRRFPHGAAARRSPICGRRVRRLRHRRHRAAADAEAPAGAPRATRAAGSGHPSGASRRRRSRCREAVAAARTAATAAADAAGTADGRGVAGGGSNDDARDDGRVSVLCGGAAAARVAARRRAGGRPAASAAAAAIRDAGRSVGGAAARSTGRHAAVAARAAATYRRVRSPDDARDGAASPAAAAPASAEARQLRLRLLTRQEPAQEPAPPRTDGSEPAPRHRRRRGGGMATPCLMSQCARTQRQPAPRVDHAAEAVAAPTEAVADRRRHLRRLRHPRDLRPCAHVQCRRRRARRSRLRRRRRFDLAAAGDAAADDGARRHLARRLRHVDGRDHISRQRRRHLAAPGRRRRPRSDVAAAAASPPVAMGASTQHLLEAEVEQARERLAEVEKELAVAKGTATRHADERRKMMKSLADSRTETAAWRQKVLAKKAPPPKPAAKADVTKPAFPVAAERKLRIKARTAALRASLRASNFGQLRLRLAARAAFWRWLRCCAVEGRPKPEPSPKKEWGPRTRPTSPSAPSRLNPIPVRSALKPPSARRTPAAAAGRSRGDARHRTRRRRAAAGAADTCVAAREARIAPGARQAAPPAARLVGRRRRPPVVPLRAAPCVRQLARRDASAAVGAAVVAVADAAVALTAAAVPLTALAAAVAAGGRGTAGGEGTAGGLGRAIVRGSRGARRGADLATVESVLAAAEARTGASPRPLKLSAANVRSPSPWPTPLLAARAPPYAALIAAEPARAAGGRSATLVLRRRERDDGGRVKQEPGQVDAAARPRAAARRRAGGRPGAARVGADPIREDSRGVVAGAEAQTSAAHVARTRRRRARRRRRQTR